LQVSGAVSLRAVESALRDVAGLHPGHPVSNIKLRDGSYIIFDGNDDEPKEEEDGDSGRRESSSSA
jgi:hypothetical protein